MTKSLIICVTPLQMLVAEKIIEKFDSHEFDLLVLALHDNEKYQYYYDRLKIKCKNSLYFSPENNVLNFIKYRVKLKKQNFLIEYDNYFFASIDSKYIQYIISKRKNKSYNINTFDDGVANIVENSGYYSSKKSKLINRIVWYFLGIRVDILGLRKLSSKHFSIYKNISNIVDNVEYLPLLNDSKRYNNCTKTIRIYLGQPLCEISDKFSEDFINSTLEVLSINMYFPHPREKNLNKIKIQIISTPMIFEDYVSDLLEVNKDLEVEVYSFISSAIINVKDMHRVKVNYIYDDLLILKYKNFYNLVADNFALPIVKL